MKLKQFYSICKKYVLSRPDEVDKALEEGKFESNLVSKVVEGKGFEIPETLCRIIKKTPVFDSEGYLLCHKVFNDPKRNYPKMWNGFDTRILPLVHPEEVETIMRYFASSIGFVYDLKLLVIESDKIEELTHRNYSYLPLHGEFFGKVQKKAIIDQIDYRWVKSSLPPNVPAELLEKSVPYFVRKTEGFQPVPRYKKKRLFGLF